MDDNSTFPANCGGDRVKAVSKSGEGTYIKTEDEVERLANFNSGTNVEMSIKFEIKDEQMDDDSTLSVECNNDRDRTLSENRDGIYMKIEDKVGRSANFESGTNEEMCTQFEIKDELMSDVESLISAKSTDDTVETLSEDCGNEIDCEDSKIDIKFVEDNLKEIDVANLNSANKDASLKSEIKDEPIDGSLILTDCIDDTAYDFSEDKHTYKFDPESDNLNSNNTIHTGEKPYQCDVCDKRFVVPRNLKVHKRIHTGEKPYKCDVCEMCFAQSNNLYMHKWIHTGEKPYACDVCKKSYRQLINLNRHKLIHTGEKPHQCDVCNKRFILSTDLIRHKRVHTGEKPFKCDVCEKCFSQSSTLFRHKRIHTGENPHQCDVCSKRFITLSELTIHKRIHTGEKPYRCDVCEKCFAQAPNLFRHKRVIHASEKPYQCDVCNKRFTSSKDLIRHKSIHTRGKP